MLEHTNSWSKKRGQENNKAAYIAHIEQGNKQTLQDMFVLYPYSGLLLKDSL